MLSVSPSQHEGELLPPEKMREFVGGGDFKIVGEAFRDYLVNLGGLRPDDRLLDVGCGCGRIAVPLTGYLSDKGSFEGFDIYKEGIEWCTRNITARRPNFRFRFADIYNKRYNPLGRSPASSFRFPYPDDSFDFVVASSVFTHLLRKDMTHYLSEIRRVMRTGGRCLITYFLFREEGLPDEEGKRNDIDFRFHADRYRTASKIEVEYAIAYEEAYLRELYRDFALEVVEPVHYGLQDIVVAVKKRKKARVPALQWLKSLGPDKMAEEKAVDEISPDYATDSPTMVKGIRNGIWSNEDEEFHLFVQSYENGDCVLMATLDARGYVAFRGRLRENMLRVEDDAGRQGYSLCLELTDSSHGRLTARMPTGELRAEVSCLLPAGK